MSDNRAWPAWMRSARFRIAILYSATLFVLAALLIGTLYFALHQSLKNDVIERGSLPSLEELPEDSFIMSDIRAFEQEVNAQTLDNLKQFAFGALAALFVTSLGVGWVISGRVLAPIDDIANVADEIQATDLSRRIDLDGPEDELKRLADTFDRMLARLEDAFSMQRRFVADASHELRNPLAVIRTNVDVALSNPRATPDDLRSAAEVVRRSTDRMSRMVDDLLALARLDDPALRRESVDLASIAEEVGEENRELARAADVSIDMRGSSGVSVVKGDGDALKRALANLVDNALRFAPARSSMVIEVGRAEGWVFVAVSDQGPGIPADEHERVFDRFYRTDRSRARSSGGSGLGLAIVRQIARGHGGSATVFSAPGAGATFVLWLPSEAGDRATDPPEAWPVARA